MAVPVLMEKPVAKGLTAHLGLMSRSWHYRVNERILTTRFQMVNYFLETNVMDDLIANLSREISCYVKRSTMSSLEFANKLLLRTLRCSQVYHGDAFKGSLSKNYGNSLRTICKRS